MQHPTVSVLIGDKPVASALDSSDPAIDAEVKAVIDNAAARWLKNEEVLAVLESLQDSGIMWPKEASERPEGGHLFVFNRKICRSFRSDKHIWRKKPDGRTVKETHEKLKVGDKERLNCYYAHAEDGEGLQRRCYWILEAPKDDIVLVHYFRSTTSRAGTRGHGGSSAVYTAATAGGSSGGGGRRPVRRAAQRNAAALYARDSDDELDETSEDTDNQSWLPSSSQGGSGSIAASMPEVTPLAQEQERDDALTPEGEARALMSMDIGKLDPLTAQLLQDMSVPENAHSLGSLAEQYARKQAFISGDPLSFNADTLARVGTLRRPSLRRSGGVSGSGQDPLGSGNLAIPAMSLGIEESGEGLPLSPGQMDTGGSSFRRPSLGGGDGSSTMASGQGSGAVSGPLNAALDKDSIMGLVPFSGLPLAGDSFISQLPWRNSDLGEAMASIEMAGGNPAIAAAAAAVAAVDAEAAADAAASAAAAAGPGNNSPAGVGPTPPPKVETLRRLVAPGFRPRGGGAQGSLADVARRASGGGSGDDDSPAGGSGGLPRRKNPTSAPSPLSSHDRLAAAAATAVAEKAERREELVQKLRQARQQPPPPQQGQQHVDDADELIETAPNPLFRLTSHIVRHHVSVGAENAGLDAADAVIAAADASDAAGAPPPTVENAGMLLRNMSIDERTADVPPSPLQQQQQQHAGGLAVLPGVPIPFNLPLRAPGGDIRQSPHASMAFGSYIQEGRGGIGGGDDGVVSNQQAAASLSNTTTENAHSGELQASRDPSLSSLLEATLSMQGSNPRPAGRGPPKSAVDAQIQEAMAKHAARAAAALQQQP